MEEEKNFTISLIVARGENGVIGKNGDIPWDIPEDRKWFHKCTKGKVVLMGRKTFESVRKRLGKTLSERTTMILTNNRGYDAHYECILVHSLCEALREAEKICVSELMVAGGGQIYRLFLPRATKIYLTTVHRTYTGDTYFPQFDRDAWKEALWANNARYSFSVWSKR